MVVKKVDSHAADSRYPIPDRLNIFLVMIVSVGAIGFLLLASRVESYLATFAIAIGFSYLMLTNYALLHDATHDTLHSSRRVNDWLGFVAGVWFPVPFSMIHYTHRSHHRFNRTDMEMFDLYYPSDNRVLKSIQWYSILCGLFWPLVPLGAILISILPSSVRQRILGKADMARGLYYLSVIPQFVVRRTRIETLAIIGIFAILFWTLSLRPGAVAICYACFAFNWSTRQYITHAFSPRDVVDGAFNLSHNRLMDWILLHGQWDLNHHRHPEVSWFYLPSFESEKTESRNYLAQYLRQWRGPVPAIQSAPEPLADELLVSEPQSADPLLSNATARDRDD